MKVFASLFSKSDRDPTRVALVGLRRVRNPPIVRKRHERVNFAKGKRGKTHKWGVSLVSHKCNFNCLPLFFGGKRRKEKLTKETPFFARLRLALRKLLKKLEQNFHCFGSAKATDKSKFEKINHIW